MLRSIILVSSVAILACNAAAHAQPPQSPKSVAEAPAMGGEPQTKSGPKVINLGSNEVSIARLADTKLVHVTQEQLGQLSPVLFQQSQHEVAPVPHNIATVKTALLDPARQAITFLAVQSGDRDQPAVVPWSEVKPFDQPNPVVATALSQQTVASAPPLSQEQGKTIDLEQAVLGRSVKTADGKDAGTVSDVIAEIGSGKLDYVVVQPGGLGLGTKNAAHAVPPSAMKPLSGDKSQPIALTLDEAHWKTTPVFGGSKAQETEAMRNKARATGATGPIP